MSGKTGGLVEKYRFGEGEETCGLPRENMM